MQAGLSRAFALWNLMSRGKWDLGGGLKIDARFQQESGDWNSKQIFRTVKNRKNGKSVRFCRQFRCIDKTRMWICSRPKYIVRELLKNVALLDKQTCILVRNACIIGTPLSERGNQYVYSLLQITSPENRILFLAGLAIVLSPLSYLSKRIVTCISNEYFVHTSDKYSDRKNFKSENLYVIYFYLKLKNTSFTDITNLLLPSDLRAVLPWSNQILIKMLSARRGLHL